MSQVDKIIATALQVKNGIKMDFGSALALSVDALESLIIDLPEHTLNEAEAFSYLNTPIFGALEILPGSYSIYHPDGTTEIRQYEGMILETVLVSVTQRKNIVTTQVPGLDGSIKEYISKSDFDVWAYGSLVGRTQAFPEEELRTLEAILASPETLEVRHPLLEIFGINQIVLTDYQIRPREGFQNLVPYNLQALSDRDIILDLDQVTEL